jgi:hypothetical protein
MSIKDDKKVSAPWNYLRPEGEIREALEALDQAFSTQRTNCFNRPAEFIDFDDPRFLDEANDNPAPNRDVARVLCEDCFAFDLCKNYAAIAKPDFGVYAGEVWIGGKKK